MKLLIVLVSTIFTTSIFACTDFTGNFKDNDGSITNLVQDACKSIKMTNLQDSTSITVYNDGQTHLSLQQDIVVEGKVVGKITMFTKMAFQGASLIIDMTANVDTNEQSQTQTTHMESSLNANGDLVSIQTVNGETETSISTRVK